MNPDAIPEQLRENWKTIAVVGLLALTVAVVLAPIGPNIGETESTAAMDDACAAQFGEGYEMGAWMEGNPPEIKCHNGEQMAWMDMPADIAHEKDIKAAAYGDGGGSE